MDRDAFAWLPILARKFDEGSNRIQLLRSYIGAGTPPMPEMGKNTRASWQAFQRKACLDLGGIIVSSAADRIRLAGVVVGKERSDAEAKARRILRDTRFEAVLAEAVSAALTDGEAYLMTAVNDDGKAVITAETRQHVITSTDPTKPWEPRAAAKFWRDLDLQLDYAYVFDGTYRVKFQRPVRNRRSELLLHVQGGGWDPVDITEVGKVPLVVLKPSPDGVGTYEAHIDAIDRVHHGILNRLVTSAMQAYRQRALKGGLAVEDENSNPVDWGKVFEPAPGALWDLPEGIDVWESQQTDIRPMLQASQDDLRDLAAVSRTPLSALTPDSGNQSAEAAAMARETLVWKVRAYLERLQPAVELAIKRALVLEDPTILGEDDDVVALFAPPELTSLAERMNALVQAQAAGMPWRTRMLSIGGYSAEEVDRMELERLDDAMQASALVAGPVAPAPVQPEAPTPAK